MKDIRVAVVYDSWFGNTQKIAEAIAGTLELPTSSYNLHEGARVDMQDIDLLIVGSPTHGGVATPRMDEFLNSLQSENLAGKLVATFDTRVGARWVGIIGFASKHIAKRLAALGATAVVEPEGFYVEGKEGPLREGEFARAQLWARQIESYAQTVARQTT